MAARTGTRTKESRYSFDNASVRRTGEYAALRSGQVNGYTGGSGGAAQGYADGVSLKTARNRRKALAVSRGFVLFLAIMSCLTVLMCVQYLRLKETITAQTRVNNSLMSELNTLKSENDALLENVTNSIEWDHVKDVAINEMHMKYATEDEVVWYNTESSGYVRQYLDVP